MYRVVLRNPAAVATSRFLVKVREAQVIEVAAPEPSDTITGETPPADDSMNSLSDIAADLTPAVGLAEGNRAPGFTIETLDDDTLALDDLRGRVVLLNFWGTWCGPCRREMPEFQKAYAEWNAKGFDILAIAYNDTEEAMADFRDEYGLRFPLALDESGEINDAYGVQTRPSSYLLDRDGLILARHFGIMTESQLSELLNEALAEA